MSLKVANTTYLYETETASSRKGIEAVSFNLKQGNSLSILGRSGSGKSTLLKCIAGLIDVQEGEVWLDDEHIKGPNYNLVPGYKTIQYVAQDFDLKPDYTARENINHHLDYNYTKKQKEQIVNRLIRLFSLKDVEHQYPRQLSGGQQQRVAIASSLAEMPKLLLLDEPFNDLDFYTKTKTIELLKHACEVFNTSVILVTHNYEEAFALCDTLMVMNRGKIVQKGKVEKLFNNPKNQTVASLMGDYSVLRKGEIIRGNTLEKDRIIRPKHIRVAKDGKGNLSINISECEYFGNYYRCVGETEKGSEMVFYSSNELKDVVSLIIHTQNQ